MNTRNLYAEIAEGFAAISDARDGSLTLHTVYVLIPESGNLEPKAGGSETVKGILDSPAGEIF